uniref:N-acetyltransferase domain-containing protein n=1 Tax=Coturnix japonica TaxID=93934 RepID=A0A8C2T4G6_COTJA
MAPYRIRLYRDEDYDAVRSLFARGIMEHAPAMYRHVLCLTRVQLGLLSLFWAVCAMAGSWLLALAAVVLVLALVLGGSWGSHVVPPAALLCWVTAGHCVRAGEGGWCVWGRMWGSGWRWMYSTSPTSPGSSHSGCTPSGCGAESGG